MQQYKGQFSDGKPATDERFPAGRGRASQLLAIVKPRRSSCDSARMYLGIFHFEFTMVEGMRGIEDSLLLLARQRNSGQLHLLA